MSQTITELHQKVDKTKEHSSYGLYVVKESKFEKWAKYKSLEICPNGGNEAVRIQNKLCALGQNVQGFEKDDALQLNYSVGGRSSAQSVFIMVKNLHDETIA